jgi:hypothetical protein
MEETCASCKFWQEVNDEWGKCRRHPPVLDVLQVEYARDNGYTEDDYASQSILWWSQPATSECSWCGEWVLRSNAPHEGPGAASSRTVPLDAVVGRHG